MEKLSALDVFIIGIPQVLLMLVSISLLSGQKIILKKFLISCLILIFTTVGVRMLPINFGIHIVINVTIIIILSVLVSNMNILIAIKASLYTTILLFSTETISVLVLNIVFDGNFQQMMEEPLTKTLMGIPSLILMGGFLINYYYYKKRVAKNRNEEN